MWDFDQSDILTFCLYFYNTGKTLFLRSKSLFDCSPAISTQSNVMNENGAKYYTGPGRVQGL